MLITTNKDILINMGSDQIVKQLKNKSGLLRIELCY